MKNLFLALVLFFMGCGYYPVSHYSKKSLGDLVYVDLRINLANTENSVELKDILNKAIVARFQRRLAEKDQADSIINLFLRTASDTSIATDTNGFTTFYRVNVEIVFNYENRFGKKGEFVNVAYSDYAVSLEDPLITYSNRLEAIKEASIQCIDKFLAQMAYEGR